MSLSATHNDMLERPIQKGDYVVSYNNVYEVTDLLGKPGGRFHCAYLVARQIKNNKIRKEKCQRVLYN